MVRVIGYALGSDGSTFYRAASGDFFIYPFSRGGWQVIWEPVGKLGPPPRRFASRSTCIKYVECHA